MRKKSKYLILLFMFIAIGFVLFLLNSQKNDASQLVVNGNIIQVKNFELDAKSTNLKTMTQGTIFVDGEKEQIDHIKIVAHVEIDPTDWGGVAFYIPDQWSVSSITSSYPEHQSKLKPAEYVSTWKNSSDDSSWRTMIEIGRERDLTANGGGTGTIVIDLSPDQKGVTTSESLKIGIEVGSEDKNGKQIMGTDSVEVPVF
ncbi:hypothetical protein EC604_29075 [Paenibacillus amylolyticus]|uniref:Uncharacterized protein n=1 Tax=Paenibacillus amylolyticus TaxID=1451 RepID=A0A5M9X268_PAEAM|nr:hypothetical protein [Paenibacillus amylolyticus]KAA8787879.1 hypothetical protein EC604_29075 [Paenibacillus amylolyticus]